MNTGDIVVFDAKKNFRFIKKLGGGGTGDTHLFKDETTDMYFAIKKYMPKDQRYIDDHYRRFVDECVRRSVKSPRPAKLSSRSA